MNKIFILLSAMFVTALAGAQAQPMLGMQPPQGGPGMMMGANSGPGFYPTGMMPQQPQVGPVPASQTPNAVCSGVDRNAVTNIQNVNSVPTFDPRQQQH